VLSVAQRSQVGKAEKPPSVARGDASRLPWAWDDLCFGVAFNSPDWEGTRDLVNGLAPVTRSGVAWTRDAAGNTAANLSNSAYILFPDNPAHDRPTTELTAYVRLKWAGTSDTYGGLLSNKISLSSPWATWAINQNSTNGGWLEAQTSNAGTYWGITSAGVPLLTTEFSSVFLRWRSGELSTLHVLSERGQTRSVADSGTAPTGSLTYQAGEAIRVNASEDTASNFSGHYSQAMVWSRRLSTVEMQALVADPFGWISPARTTVVLGGAFPILPSVVARGAAGGTSWR
jgi:hypothetical protein